MIFIVRQEFFSKGHVGALHWPSQAGVDLPLRRGRAPEVSARGRWLGVDLKGSASICNSDGQVTMVALDAKDDVDDM